MVLFQAMFSSNVRAKMTLAFATGIGTGLGFAFLLRRFSLSRDLFSKSDPLKKLVIHVARTESECTALVRQLQENLGGYRALGFDCEWTSSPYRNPVALLQLATVEGFCVLFRLCELTQFPSSLRDLLEDRTIFKIGVECTSDQGYLLMDYSVDVRGTLDIRHITRHDGRMSLAAIVFEELGIMLPKGHIRTSNWEAKCLTEAQKRYAALDAFSSMLVFRKIVKNQVRLPYFSRTENAWQCISEQYSKYLDKKYHPPSIGASPNTSNDTKLLKRVNNKPPRSFHTYASRQKPLYDNCVMLAPDGETLNTCDRKRAEWYVSKELAIVEKTDPFTIKLTFEPSGRAEGDSGQYYVKEKENQCVVCGRKDSYIRKKIVPHEYRKYFPESMKSHKSHDVLLLCVECNINSNSQDLQMRRKLEDMCCAPYMKKVVERTDIKAVKSAARALYNSNNQLPEKRREELTSVILTAFPDREEVTPDLLEELQDISTFNINELYEPHGEVVVKCFLSKGKEGLMELERLWRSHFLENMQPKHLPPLWSVDHRHEKEQLCQTNEELNEKHYLC